jgi:hypothetical protein
MLLSVNSGHSTKFSLQKPNSMFTLRSNGWWCIWALKRSRPVMVPFHGWRIGVIVLSDIRFSLRYCCGMGILPMRCTGVPPVPGLTARAKMALGHMGETPMPRK